MLTIMKGPNNNQLTEEEKEKVINLLTGQWWHHDDQMKKVNASVMVSESTKKDETTYRTKEITELKTIILKLNRQWSTNHPST